MSLLFYDFNHHTQLQKTKTATAATISSASTNAHQKGGQYGGVGGGQHLSNLADVVIPEEAAEENMVQPIVQDQDSIAERSGSSDEEKEEDYLIEDEQTPY